MLYLHTVIHIKKHISKNKKQLFFLNHAQQDHTNDPVFYKAACMEERMIKDSQGPRRARLDRLEQELEEMYEGLTRVIATRLKESEEVRRGHSRRGRRKRYICNIYLFLY